MSLLLEQFPTDQSHQKLLGQHLRTILEVVDELVSQIPLEAQVWAVQARQELHAGVDLMEQELELLGLHQICTLRRALDERDHQIAALQARLAVEERAMEPPIATAPLSNSVAPIFSDTLEHLFEDLEGLPRLSLQQTPTLSDEPTTAVLVHPIQTVESELQTITIAESSSLKVPDSAEFETLCKDFQQLQADFTQQKQQLESITAVIDQQKTENQQLQSLVTSLEEKLAQKETDLEKSMIRSLLLEAGLDPDVE